MMEQLDIQRQIIEIIHKQCADSDVLRRTQPITAETAIQKELEFQSCWLFSKSRSRICFTSGLILRRRIFDRSFPQ